MVKRRIKKVKKTQANLIHVRLSDPMLRMMEDIITRNLHVTISEFIRDSIIEYVKNNYPSTFEHYKGERLKSPNP